MRSECKASVRLVKSGNLGNVSWPFIDVGIFLLLLTGYNKPHLCKKQLKQILKDLEFHMQCFVNGIQYTKGG